MQWFSTIKNDKFWALADVQKVRGLVNAYFKSKRYTNVESIFTDMEHLLDKVFVYLEQQTIIIKTRKDSHLIVNELPDLKASLQNDTGVLWEIEVVNV